MTTQEDSFEGGSALLKSTVKHRNEEAQRVDNLGTEFNFGWWNYTRPHSSSDERAFNDVYQNKFTTKVVSPLKDNDDPALNGSGMESSGYGSEIDENEARQMKGNLKNLKNSWESSESLEFAKHAQKQNLSTFPREVLGHQYSGVLPFYEFLNEGLNVDDGKNCELRELYNHNDESYQRRMFSFINEELGDVCFSHDVRKLVQDFQALQDAAFVKIEPPVGHQGTEDKPKEDAEAEEEGVVDGAAPEKDTVVKESYQRQDMNSYRLYFIEGKYFAIQTIYDYKTQEHRIAFHEVVGDEEVVDDSEIFPSGDNKGSVLNELFSIKTRAAEDRVKTWLTNTLVSYRIIGQFVFYFTMSKKLDDTINQMDRKASGEVENGNVDSERGLMNDQLKWEIQLHQYNLLEQEDGIIETYEHECEKNEKGNEDEDDVADDEYYEVLGVLFAEPFGCNISYSSEMTAEQALVELTGKDMDQHYAIIIEAVVTPDYQYGIDWCQNAKMHMYMLKDFADGEKKLNTFELDHHSPNIEKKNKESHINLQNPIKFFLLRDQQQIDVLRSKIQLNFRGESDVEHIIPEGICEIVILFTSNDGSNTSQELPNDLKILPDIFQMIIRKEISEKEKDEEASEDEKDDGFGLCFKSVTMVQHRKAEANQDTDSCTAHIKNHQRLNQIFQFIEYHNTSTESWYDRREKKFFNQNRSFCRNEFEFIKHFYHYCLEQDDFMDYEYPVNANDKVYQGKGQWYQGSQAIINCAINSNKDQGKLTILVHILQDIRISQVKIYTIELRQWYNLTRTASLNDDYNFNHYLANFFRTEEGMENINPVPPLVTFSRHCSNWARIDTKICMDGSICKSVTDGNLDFEHLIGRHVYVDTDNTLCQLAKVEANIEAHIKNTGKEVVYLYPQEGGFIKRIRVFKNNVRSIDKYDWESKDFEFNDGITREKIYPLQQVFVEDKMPYVHILAYNIKDKFITDMAFALIDEDGNLTSLNLQLGKIPIVNLQREEDQICLNVSSELAEGLRMPFIEPRNLIEKTFGSPERYYTQNFQACVIDPTISSIQVIEIACKYFEDGKHEVGFRGVKKIVLNCPNDIQAVMYPLYERVDQEAEEDGETVANCYKIVGTQLVCQYEKFPVYWDAIQEVNAALFGMSSNSSDEEEEGLMPEFIIVDYKLRNPTTFEDIKPDKLSCNNIYTLSRLQEIRDGFQGVIAETWIKPEIVQMQNFQMLEQRELLRLLNNANLVTINMKSLDIPEFVNCPGFMNLAIGGSMLVRETFSQNMKRLFGALELYNGHSIAEMMKDSQKVEEYVKRMRKQVRENKFTQDYIESAFAEKYALNSLEKVVRSLPEEESKKFYTKLVKTGILLNKEVVGFNINMDSLIQLKIAQKDLRSAGLLIDYLQQVSTNDTFKYQNIMASLYNALQAEWWHKSLFGIFLDSSAGEQDASDGDYDEEIDSEDEEVKVVEQAKEMRLRIPLPNDIITALGFPKNSDDPQGLINSEFKVDEAGLDYYSQRSLTFMGEGVKDKLIEKEDAGDYALSYSAIVVRDYKLAKKLQDISSSGSRKSLEANIAQRFGIVEQMEMFQNIIYMNSDELENNGVLRDIIDSYFKLVLIVSKVRMWFYIIFFAIPIFLQMFAVTGGWAIGCCIIASLAQILLFAFEIIDIKTSGLKEYLNNFWNIVDFTAFVLTLIYSILRFTKPISFLPVEDMAKDHYNLKNSDVYAYSLFGVMPFLNVILIWLTFMQLLYYLKSDPKLGNLVQLVTYCINQLWTFVSFLCLFLALFALSFRILGATFDEDMFEKDYNSDLNDYQMVPSVAVYILQTFRNSIGDLSTPHYNYWITRYKLGENRFALTAILFIWFVWVIEVYLMVIILTNFLIALVSQIYEQIQSSKLQTDYTMKVEFNVETLKYTQFIASIFKYPIPNFDYIILRASSDEDSGAASEWQGMIRAIKKNIKPLNHELQQIRKQNDQILKEIQKLKQD